MTIPFLKRKLEPNIAGDEDSIERKSDKQDYSILDAIAEDMMDAFDKKSKELMVAALESLCEYVREEDEEQDEMQ